MDEACKCRRSDRKSSNGAVGDWGICSLENANPKDQTVSSHVTQDDICGSKDTCNEEDSFLPVCGPLEDILKLAVVRPARKERVCAQIIDADNSRNKESTAEKSGGFLIAVLFLNLKKIWGTSIFLMTCYSKK